MLSLDNDATRLVDEPSPDLLEILSLNQPEPVFGPEIQSNVAESFKNLGTTILPKEKVDELKKPFLTPLNCKQLGVPKVNPEIWGVMSSEIKQSDFQQQQMQGIVSCSTVALAQLAEIIMKNSKTLKPELSQDLLRLTVQAATLNSKLSQDINIKRKQDIKPCLNNEIVAVCNTPSSPEFLFGDNVCETIKATKAAAAVMKPYFSNRDNSLNYNRAFTPRGGGPRFNYRQPFNPRGSTFRPQQKQQYRPQ